MVSALASFDFYLSYIKSELRQIVKATRGWFSGLKGRAKIKFADKNGNGYV
ncbi:hypothetical protein Hanom_Chr14g01281311 [Helianthus anomalus]